MTIRSIAPERMNSRTQAKPASELSTRMQNLMARWFSQDFAAQLCSTEFPHDARHSDHPTAFSRCRKLPLATLVAIVLTGMRMSIQAEREYAYAK